MRRVSLRQLAALPWALTVGFLLSANSAWTQERAADGEIAFHRIWQLEVAEGRLRDAAELWVEFYESRAGTTNRDRRPPRWDRGRLAGIEAALRAGRCFEKLGNDRRAELAYRWLLSRFDRSPATDVGVARRRDARTGPLSTGPAARARLLRDRALLRLRQLDAPRASDSADDPAVAAAIDEFAAAHRLLAARLERVRQTVVQRRHRVDVARALVDRLRRLGVDLQLPRREFGAEVADLELTASIEPFFDSKARLQRAIEALASRFVTRGLQAAANRELDLARWELDKARALEQLDGIDSLRDRLDRGGSPDRLARLASLRLAGWEGSVTAAKRQRGRFLLLSADQLDRQDRRLRELEKARGELDGLATGSRVADAEIDALSRQIDARYLLAAPVALQKRLEEHAQASREDRVRLLDHCEQLVDLICEEALINAASHVGDGVETATVVRELVRAAEKAGVAASNESADDARLESTLLGRWFPTFEGIATSIDHSARSDDEARQTEDGQNSNDNNE